MSQFPRQKRQARTYWAELGFLVLGLFALQPNLLRSLFSGTQINANSYADRPYYPVNQNYANSNSQSWQANSMGSMYLPAYQNPIYIGQQAWVPQRTIGSLPPANSNSSALLQAQYQPTPAMNQSYVPWDYNQAQQHSVPTGYGYQQPYQNAQPWANTARNDWQSQQSYDNQGTGRFSASTQTNGQWPTHPDSTGRGSSYPSNMYAGSSSNPFKPLVTKPAQPSLFGSGSSNYGADSYLSGRANSTSQRFPYPTNSSSTNSFTPYRPGSNLTR